MEKRKIGEGASDHTDKRTEASPSELSAEIPAARCRETTDGNSSTSVQPAPTGSPATCCPASPWELTHTLHILGWRTSLLNSPHQEGLGKENKRGKKSNRGGFLFSQTATTAVQFNQTSLRSRGGESTQSLAAYNAPTDNSKAASE